VQAPGEDFESLGNSAPSSGVTFQEMDADVNGVQQKESKSVQLVQAFMF